jgi:hypothetical protein
MLWLWTGSSQNPTSPVLDCDILRESGTGVFYHVKLRNNGALGLADTPDFWITVTTLIMTANEVPHALEHTLEIKPCSGDIENIIGEL